jgi:hypothetical protein
MRNDDSTDFTRRDIDFVPAARLQWGQTAALANEASRSTDTRLHREAVEVAKSAIVRIQALLEAAAGTNAD